MASGNIRLQIENGFTLKKYHNNVTSEHIDLAIKNSLRA